MLDLAALDRKSVEPETPVQLELDGVRLKTGLKLLLDQVGLTYQVIAEDNLMIITDQEGSEDPADRIWAELRAFIATCTPCKTPSTISSDFLGVEGGEGARVRKPTIIEEMPENGEERPGIGPEKPGRGGEKPDAAGAPAPGSRRCRRAFHWRSAAQSLIVSSRLADSEIADSRFQIEKSGTARPGLAKRMRQGSMADETGAAGAPAARRGFRAKSPDGDGSVNRRRRSGLLWPRPS